MPWVYTLDDDIFVRPQPPPSPDTLSWEPDFFTDSDGQTVEVERPMCLGLDAAAAGTPAWLNDTAWSDLTRVRQSPLFETPIAHFLVCAFLTEGIDEVLAHITTIEAALGLRSDYGGKTQPTPARHSEPPIAWPPACQVCSGPRLSGTTTAICSTFEAPSCMDER